ncbi:MAG: aminotransferase class IV, partial [Deltaproteobacteria bacterium]|nr:aminotransferase class IV [Deltaproteobacteria bacterium]
GLLPGVFRKYLLQNFPSRVAEKILTKEALQQAERVYVGNSVRGLVQVTLCSV